MWPQIYNLAAIQFLIKNRELSQNEYIQQYKQAVVVVKTDDSKGTGFNIHEHGLIVTNEHVVDASQTAFVQFPDGKTFSAEVIVRDAELDFALLQLEENEGELPVLQIDPEPSWKANDPVHVIGNPLFFSHIANEGVILGVTRVQDRASPVLMLQAPIFKGNSGSPVLDKNGLVIGVVFATSSVQHQGKKQKVGLAVPIEDVVQYLK